MISEFSGTERKIIPEETLRKMNSGTDKFINKRESGRISREA